MSFGTWVVLLVVTASPYSVWQEVYDGGNTDKGHGVCLDSANHVVIVGESNPEMDFNSWMIVVSKSGDSLWSKFYDGGDNEKGIAVATTQEGSIAIAVDSEAQTIHTVFYNQSGDLLWSDSKSAGNDAEATAITISPTNNIYTLGWRSGISFDNLVIHGYNYEGQSILDVDYRSAYTRATGIVVTSSDYIYVGSDKLAPSALWRFSPEGEYKWVSVYGNTANKSFGLEMNTAPHLFQSGDVATTGSNSDFLLLKWDTAGALIWPEHKAYDLGHNEYCRDIKLDAISDCYLAGWQMRGLEKDAALVKTDSAGRMLWSWVYEMEGDQEIEGIEVDEDGYIYLAGSHHNGANWDMLVMQVRQPLIITGRVTDSVGSSMENIRVVLTGDTTVEVRTDTGGYYGIEVYNGGSYTVSPDLPGWAFLPSSYTYSPLAHREFDQDFSGEWTGIGENVNPPYPSWELISSCGSSITLKYSGYPDGFHASVFNASGRKVDGIYATSSAGTATWGDNHSPGVYFIRTCSKGISLVRRVLIVQ
jgi:hypothetical protein